MRKKQQDQMPLMMTDLDHPRAEELKRISDILDQYPIISEMVWQDLTGQGQKQESGAHGMSAEQVLRAAIVKQTEGFSYEDLAFHILDSRCYRTFCRIGITQKGIGKSALASVIKSIRPCTWESINRILTAHAEDQGVEKGRESRIDCTVVESNIEEKYETQPVCFDVADRAGEHASWRDAAAVHPLPHRRSLQPLSRPLLRRPKPRPPKRPHRKPRPQAAPPRSPLCRNRTT